nr:queuosine precursor transporter [Tessaracoccus bendigoensis]
MTARMSVTLGLAGSFMVACVLANLWSVRIVSSPFGPLDAGTLVYPLTFTLRDLIHRQAGAKAAEATIILAGALSAAAALGTWVVGAIPASPEVAQSAAQIHFGDVLSLAPRIVIASVVAQIASGWFDTRLYSWWVARHGNHGLLGRVAFSNLGSIPLDSVLFAGIAFLGELPVSVIVGIILSNVVLKTALSLVIAPGIYLVSTAHGSPSP